MQMGRCKCGLMHTTAPTHQINRSGLYVTERISTHVLDGSWISWSEDYKPELIPGPLNSVYIDNRTNITG